MPKRIDRDVKSEMKENSHLHINHDILFQKTWNPTWRIMTLAGIIATGALRLVRGNADWEERLGVSVAVLPLARVALPLGLVKVIYQQWDLSDLWRGRRKRSAAVRSNAVPKEDFTIALILTEDVLGLNERN